MKKIFLVLFLLVFCAYSQNDSDKNQSTEISGSMKAPSIKEAKKACENKEKNACITAVSMMLSEANSSADELKEAYKLAQIGCDINEDMSCVFYSQALLFGVFEDENINEGLKTLEHSCQNGGAMSCANLSDIYFFGHFSQNKDEQKAKLYLDKICKNRKDFCPMAKAMEQSHAQISQSKIAVPPQNLWLSQNLVREKSLKTYELREAPDEVALDIIHFLTGTQEKLICDEPQSSECKSLLDEQCKGQENEEFCRSYMLTWNSSPRHESIAHDGARYFLDGMLSQYDKNKFIYFVKYAYNKRLPLNQLLSITAGYDDNTGDELPLILALARNNATEPLQERIYGISGGDSELMELFRTYKISPKIAEIFTK
ncbi:hypothetical protein [Campylobacter sp.]|uniref:hypothetical protein n=1 Tax=Campylobacter sp. TaxID=205 RepID=UPI002AA8392C|nr:hypothetical protein [Campylobacter sp.]MCI7236875.1 hypothetical protein [Campylobacter sp.]